MTRDDIRKLAAKPLPCVCSVDCDRQLDCHEQRCWALKRPAVEAAIIEACERVLEEAANICDQMLVDGLGSSDRRAKVALWAAGTNIRAKARALASALKGGRR